MHLPLALLTQGDKQMLHNRNQHRFLCKNDMCPEILTAMNIKTANFLRMTSCSFVGKCVKFSEKTVPSFSGF